MSGLYYASYYFTWIETMVKEWAWLADPASSVHLDAGIGGVPIRYVPCALRLLLPRNCLWRDLDNDIILVYL